MNSGEGNVRGVAVRTGGQKSRPKHMAGERFGGRRQIQYGESGHEFEAALRHRAFSSGNFVEHDLRGEKLVPGALQVPPIFAELLASSLQKVASRARNDVARNRAFNVDAHVVLTGFSGFSRGQ